MTTTIEAKTALNHATPVVPASGTSVRVFVVVEGTNDIEFLTRISRVLHDTDPTVPDLGALAKQAALIFLPLGGSDDRLWTDRLAPLGIPEFHLRDRDVPPLSEEHEAAIQAVNRRQGCIAAMTGFRHVENYLHPMAIYQARHIKVEFTGQDDLADLVARRAYLALGGRHQWRDIPSRKRRQLKHRAKRWLNTEAVDQMTAELLDQQDPQGDVRSWLEAIGWLAQQ